MNTTAYRVSPTSIRRAAPAVDLYRIFAVMKALAFWRRARLTTAVFAPLLTRPRSRQMSVMRPRRTSRGMGLPAASIRRLTTSVSSL